MNENIIKVDTKTLQKLGLNIELGESLIFETGDVGGGSNPRTYASYELEYEVVSPTELKLDILEKVEYETTLYKIKHVAIYNVEDDSIKYLSYSVIDKEYIEDEDEDEDYYEFSFGDDFGDDYSVEENIEQNEQPIAGVIQSKLVRVR